MEMSGQFHAPFALHLGKESQYPISRKLGGPQSSQDIFSEEKNLCLSLELNHNSSVV